MPCFGRNYTEGENKKRIWFELSKFTNTEWANDKNEYEKSSYAVMPNEKLGCM